MTTLYDLRDYRESFQFEKEHPKQVRWDDKYKLYMLTQEENVQGIWLRDKTGLAAEIIMSWQSDNVVHIDSFTVLPQFRGKGIGYRLVQVAMEWAEEHSFQMATGEARKGAPWTMLENLGARVVLSYKNYRGTGEEYVLFKIEI